MKKKKQIDQLMEMKTLVIQIGTIVTSFTNKIKESQTLNK